MISLLCTAGGARGAYQAGVLKRIGNIKGLQGKPSPFKIVSGASAGAINGSAIAAGSLDFHRTTETLAELWSNLKMDDIINTNVSSLGGIAAKWIKDLSFGGLIGGGNVQSLLDGSPLLGFLTKHLYLEGIQDSIDKGALYACAVTATNYNSGKSYTFIQGVEGHPIWTKARRLAYSTKLRVDHILGSCAIPLVFAPVLIEETFGEYYYGDGALRLVTPFSAPIRLGATKVLAISVRAEKPPLLTEERVRPQPKPPSLAQVFGVALNAIFLDHLEADFDHLQRMNQIIEKMPKEGLANLSERLNTVDTLVIRPSQDIAQIAEAHSDKIPLAIRYLMDGLGSGRAESSDLMSYLLFDKAFTDSLIDLGYKDADHQIAKIEEFLLSS